MQHPDLQKLSCFYARVSTELQEEQQTIQSQIDELKRAIANAGETLVMSYTDDGYSGELLDRPGLDQLRDDARRHIWGKVYISSPDRLARKQHIAGLLIDELRANGIEVVFLNRPLGDTVEDNLLFNIQAIFADYEKAKIKERQRRGKLFKARRSVIVGGKPPYGYTYVRDAQSRDGRYVINREEAEVVKLIYSLYCRGNGVGFRGVVRELYERRIPTRSGKAVWNSASISAVLSDETYIGTTYYNKRRRIAPRTNPAAARYKRLANSSRAFRDKAEWIPIAVPPIVSRTEFERAAEVKKQNTKLSTRNTKVQFLLKNLITCSRCGSTFYGQSNAHSVYYQCSYGWKTFPLPPDHRVTISRTRLDDAVWAGLSRVLADPQILAAMVNQMAATHKGSISLMTEQLKSLDLRLTELETKRGRLVGAYNEGAVTLDELKRHSEEFTTAKAHLLSRRAELEAHIAHAPKPISAAAAEQIVAHLVGGLQGADFDTRRQLVRLIVTQIVIDGQKATVKCQLPPLPTNEKLADIAFASSTRSERNSKYPFELEVPIPTAPKA